jgi:hypothetical protein
VGFSLDGWAGDHAGAVIGRQPNRLLLTVSQTGGTSPPGLFQSADFQGVRWFYNLFVSCLTPNSRNAFAVGVTSIANNTWSILLAEVDFLGGRDPWEPGIQLFSVMLGQGGDQSTTLLTALIDEAVPRIEYQPPADPGGGEEAFLLMERLRAAGSLDDLRQAY